MPPLLTHQYTLFQRLLNTRILIDAGLTDSIGLNYLADFFLLIKEDQSVMRFLFRKNGLLNERHLLIIIGQLVDFDAFADRVTKQRLADFFCDLHFFKSITQSRSIQNCLSLSTRHKTILKNHWKNAKTPCF